MFILGFVYFQTLTEKLSQLWPSFSKWTHVEQSINGQQEMGGLTEYHPGWELSRLLKKKTKKQLHTGDTESFDQCG